MPPRRRRNAPGSAQNQADGLAVYNNTRMMIAFKRACDVVMTKYNMPRDFRSCCEYTFRHGMRQFLVANKPSSTMEIDAGSTNVSHDMEGHAKSHFSSKSKTLGKGNVSSAEAVVLDPTIYIRSGGKSIAGGKAPAKSIAAMTSGARGIMAKLHASVDYSMRIRLQLAPNRSPLDLLPPPPPPIEAPAPLQQRQLVEMENGDERRVQDKMPIVMDVDDE